MKVRASELKNLDSAELQRKEKDMGDELMNLRFQQHLGQLSSPIRLRLVRRSLARVKTLLKEREKESSKK